MDDFISILTNIGKGKRRKKSKSHSLEDVFDLDSYLEQPVEDRVIVNEMIQLRKFIESHVLTFYHTSKVETSPPDFEKVLRDKDKTNYAPSPEKLAAIILNPQMRRTGLRIVIAHAVFASIDFYGDPDYTLLSPEAVTMMAQFRSMRRDPDLDEADQVALSRWRILGHYLSSSPDMRNKSSINAQSSAKVAPIAYIINSVVGLFVKQQSDNDRRMDNLFSIVTRAAKIGNLLFANPSTWETRWTTSEGSTLQKSTDETESNTTGRMGKIVVFPSIWRTGSLDGRRLQDPLLEEKAELAVVEVPAEDDKGLDTRIHGQDTHIHEPQGDHLKENEGSPIEKSAAYSANRGFAERTGEIPSNHSDEPAQEIWVGVDHENVKVRNQRSSYSPEKKEMTNTYHQETYKPPETHAPPKDNQSKLPALPHQNSPEDDDLSKQPLYVQQRILNKVMGRKTEIETMHSTRQAPDTVQPPNRRSSTSSRRRISRDSRSRENH